MYVWDQYGGEPENQEAFEADAAVEINAAWGVIPPAGMEDFFECPACDIFERTGDEGASEKAQNGVFDGVSAKDE